MTYASSLSLPSPRVGAVLAGRRDREAGTPGGALCCHSVEMIHSKGKMCHERTIQTFVHVDLVKDNVRNASSVR